MYSHIENQGKPLFQEWINQWSCFGKFKSNGRYKVRQLRFIRNLLFRQEQQVLRDVQSTGQISQLTGIINMDHQLPAIRCQCLTTIHGRRFCIPLPVAPTLPPAYRPVSPLRYPILPHSSFLLYVTGRTPLYAM